MPSDLVSTALAALRQKDYAAAQKAIALYAQDNPLEFQHYLIKGLSELTLKNWQDAYNTFVEAIGFFPHQPQLWLNRGIAEENLGHLDDAAESFEQSLRLKSSQGDVYGNLSNIYRKQRRFIEAETMAHRAYELGATKSQALNSLGLALSKQGKYPAAEHAFQEARRLDPKNSDILANLANLAVDQLNFTTAWTFFAEARAVEDKPIIRRDEGMARILAGDYERGLPLYEARLELPAGLRLRPTCPRYRGEPLMNKKLMLLAEQGLGDTLMLSRHKYLFAQSGAELIWVVQKPLQRLLEKNLPGLVLTENSPLPEADYYIPLLSLPMNSGAAQPYLVPPAELHLLNPIAGTRKIGLIWAGSSTHERDHERSIPLEQFLPLFNSLKAQFYAPFVGTGLKEITVQTPIISLESQITDFADTAAFLSQLECLITVDTAAAHLAGALGIKTYLLLQHCPDWRWGTQGDATTWYPTMTLLRQPSYGDWESVIKKLTEKLV